MVKEWRVYVKGFKGTSGHYIIAKTKAQAIKEDKKGHRRNDNLDANLWKTGENIYELKLTPLARKRMKLK